MKLFKLFVHQKTYQKGKSLIELIEILKFILKFNFQDVLINQKDYPSLKIGDLIEIYSPEDDYRFVEIVNKMLFIVMIC